MENSNPKLKFFLAKSALMHFYRNQYWTSDEIYILRNFFGVNNSEKMWKLKMRLLWEENNDMLVGAVIADADNEQQIFLHEKYRLNWSFVKIGIELHIHPNGLQRWRDKFLAEIASLLEYNLPTADKLGYRIIRAKILNPHMSVEELESYSGTSHTTIANYVHYFQKKFLKKINFDFHNNSIYNH